MEHLAGRRIPATMLAPRLVQFLAVAHCENVSRAAELLGIGQPALSRAITRLEADLGLTLFVRHGRRLQLTPVGQDLADRLTPLIDELNAHVREVINEAGPQHGHVRIGFLKSMAEEVAPTMLAAFHASHPDIRIAMTAGSNDDLVAALLSRELDLAMLAPAPDHPSIDTDALDVQALTLEVSSSHRLAHAQRVALSELKREPFVTMTRQYGTRQIFDALCAQAGFTPNIVFEADDTRTVRALVASGTGIALLPPASHPHPDVVALEVAEPKAVRELCLAWAAQVPFSEPMRSLQTFLQAQRGRVLR
jgi:DNA-binding transcriptional LysR family regulator